MRQWWPEPSEQRLEATPGGGNKEEATRQWVVYMCRKAVDAEFGCRYRTKSAWERIRDSRGSKSRPCSTCQFRHPRFGGSARRHPRPNEARLRTGRARRTGLAYCLCVEPRRSRPQNFRKLNCGGCASCCGLCLHLVQFLLHAVLKLVRRVRPEHLCVFVA